VPDLHILQKYNRSNSKWNETKVDCQAIWYRRAWCNSGKRRIGIKVGKDKMLGEPVKKIEHIIK
jgi:peptidyl-tRNA hydrolase